MSAREVIIVIDNEAIRVPRRVWELFRQCAGQMIEDGALYDFYAGRERKRLLDGVFDLYAHTGASRSP